ncbi:MAG: hypothetical protein KGI45_02535 [Patescibacteria group bacterium]|nr:hypothetical protein [Patescibacteria group bacterium]
MKNKMIAGVAGAALLAGICVPVFAQVGVSGQADIDVQGPGMRAGSQASVDVQMSRPAPATQGQNGWARGGFGGSIGVRPAIVGIVTAVNGTTITVASRGFAYRGGQGAADQATTTFTVDASGAAVINDNATSTLSSVSVGDHVFVIGTLSGTSVTATLIRDGMIPNPRRGGPGGNGAWAYGSSTAPFKGNGQPIVAGTVQSISGSTITITTSSDTSYTIDASSAAVAKGGATSTISSISTGDYIVVQGAVNGSNVTASSVIDQSASLGGPGMNGNAPHQGFFQAIGNFFRHLFGF